MDVRFNNQENNGLVLFDGVPNILTVSDLGYGGTKARLIINLNDAIPEVGNTITIKGETITAVNSQSSASSRQFGISGTTQAICNNISGALKSVTSIVSAYNVTFTATSVIITAYGYGESFKIEYDSDIQGIEFEYDAPSQGSSAKSVNVAITVNNPTVTANLSKTIASDKVSFDLSPVLSSLSEYGIGKPVQINTTVSDVEGEITALRPFYQTVVKGGHIKGQPDYMHGDFFAVPVQGAPDRDVHNNVALYAAQGSNIPVSYYTTSGGDLSARVQLLDSGYSVIDRLTLNLTAEANTFVEFVAPSNFTDNPSAWYVSVILPNDDVIRYNIIRNGFYREAVRLYWRTSMGGINFFDFTGERSDTTEISTEVVYDEGSAYGYYSDEYRYDSRVRLSKTKKTYTVNSHVMEGIGLSVMDDLASSPLVWIEENGRKNVIIISKAEKQRVAANDTWRIRVQYYYSVNE